MDRRMFILGSAAAAAVYGSRSRRYRRQLSNWARSTAASAATSSRRPVPRLPLLDQADVGDDLAPSGRARDEAAIRQIREHADRLGIKLQLAHRLGVPELAVVQSAARHARSAGRRARSRRRRSSAPAACAASSAAIPNGRRSTCTSTTWSKPSGACGRALSILASSSRSRIMAATCRRAR